MFTNISMAGVGGAILAIEVILKTLGFEFADGTVADAVNGLVVFAGFVWFLWGQYRRKDLTWGILRK